MTRKAKKFESFTEYLLALKKASEDTEAIDDRLEIDTDVVRKCPNCSKTAEGILGKLHSCPECGSLWHLINDKGVIE